MKPAESLQALPAVEIDDVQNRPDDRNVAIDEVGIDELTYPVTVLGRDGAPQQTVAQVAMTVSLSPHLRGVHMSRFVEVLHASSGAVSPSKIRQMASDVQRRLEAEFAHVELRFPFFLERTAPASSLHSLMQYDATLSAEVNGDRSDASLAVRVPITSLCPCSKEISDYGAHNQRGYVEIKAESPWPFGEASGLWLEDLIEVAEAAGSAPVMPLLKRIDEREMTMLAFDNPAFVEDIVRNVAVALRDDVRVGSFRVRATNQESIHNHNAIAQLRWERGRGE
jgi:GTP cyclohydrolase IB